MRCDKEIGSDINIEMVIIFKNSISFCIIRVFLNVNRELLFYE